MVATDAERNTAITESQRLFDLAVPLTTEELSRFGLLTVFPTPMQAADMVTSPVASFPVVQELEDDAFAPVDAVGALVESESYNARYMHYLRCRAIATLASFEEGWLALDELVFRTYVDARRRENANYRGDDPNKAFVLRVKAQAAEDFLLFIRGMIAEAAATPKPILMKEK
jgi:hypothetical protein